MTQDIASFLKKHKLGQGFAGTAQKWFTPYAEQIAMHHNSASTPFFLGVNGCQGSGKSTLTAFLDDYLTSNHGKRVACLSLDDFYLDQSARIALAEQVHPLLATRGVPGTHDTQAIQRCLAALKAGQPTLIPRFDKATDNPAPKNQWTEVKQPVDIVIFEGWCWGVQPQEQQALLEPVNPLEQTEDPQGTWRAYVNAQLRKYYVPLYAHMDHWTMLKAPNFGCVFQWRLEQEQKLAQSRIATQETKGIMNERQIARFIQHYQRLTECALSTLSAQCDIVFELDANRQILKTQGPDA